MAKSVGSQLNLQRIPLLGLVPEARSTAPSNPVAGQLWYDTSVNRMKFYNGTTWILQDPADYVPLTQRAAANGVATLDGTTKIPIAQIPTGTTGTTVPLGNDSRLSDQRVPTDGSVTGGTAGTGVKIAPATITDANVAAANKDGAAGTPSLRTLGTGATQAVSGTDSRLSDTRAPSGPAGGSLAGTYPNPTLGTSVVTDANVAAANKDGAAGTPSLRTLGNGAGQAMAGSSRLDQIATANPATGSIDANSQKIINLATPTGTGDAANKTYVDTAVANARAGLSVKDPVKVVATTNINLGTPGGTIDGVALSAGDRFLATAQTTSTQNGIYVWNGASVAATRATDADGVGEVFDGTLVAVAQGTSAGTQFIQTATDPGTAQGTWTQTWTTFSSGGQTYVGGAGLTLTGSTFDVVAADGSITVNADNITVGLVPVAKGGTGATTAAAARGNLGAVGKYAADLGALTAGAETTITHSLGSLDVHAMFRTTADGYDYELSWRVIDANTIGVTADVAATTGSVRVVVMG